MIRYKRAPIPFSGNKYVYLSEYEKLLTIWDNLNLGKNKVVIDAFGGSGILSAAAHDVLPKSKIIYNDFDKYQARINKIPQTNKILKEIKIILQNTKEYERLNNDTVQNLIEYLKSLPDDVDRQTIKGWILHSAKNLDETWDDVVSGKVQYYNRLRRKCIDENCDYLQGLDIVNNAFPENITQWKNEKDASILVILDPPYMSTRSKNYRNAFDLDSLLKLYELEKEMLKNKVSFIRFGDATGADLISYKLIEDFAKSVYNADFVNIKTKRTSYIDEFCACAFFGA